MAINASQPDYYGVAPADYRMHEAVQLTLAVLDIMDTGEAVDSISVYNAIVARNGRRYTEGQHVAYILEMIGGILANAQTARELAKAYKTELERRQTRR